MIQNTPMQPQSCTESESGDCFFRFSMNIDGKNRDYDGFPTVDKVNKPIDTGVPPDENPERFCNNNFD